MDRISKKASMAMLFISSLLLIVLDQVTKIAAQQHLKEKGPFVLLQGVFELHYLENRGSAFGLMQGKGPFFIVMAVLMMFIIPYIYSKIPGKRRFGYLRITAVLFLSGAAGNAVDRVLHGYVIDFLYFSLIDFPIFNVADIYVTVATFSLIALILFYYKDEDFEQIHIFSKQ